MSDDRRLIAAWRAMVAVRTVQKSVVQLFTRSDGQAAIRSGFIDQSTLNKM